MGLTPWIDVSCHLHCSQALNHLVRYVLMTPFGWFSGFSFLTQCLKLKTLVQANFWLKYLFFNPFSQMVGQTMLTIFCKYSLEYMYVTFVGPTLIWKIMAVSHLIFFCALDESRFWWEWLLFKLSNRSKLMAKCYNHCINSNNSHQKILTSCITLFPIFFDTWFYLTVIFVRAIFQKNKPERVFGLQVRWRELDTFKILHFFGIFLDISGNFLGGFFRSNFLGGFFLGGFFLEDFFGGFFWENFLGRNSLFTLLKSAMLFEYGRNWFFCQDFG